MFLLIFTGLLLPLIGTALGSGTVFFTKGKQDPRLIAVLDSLAAGIMCAASFFSLIMPALSQAEKQGFIAKFSCSAGFFCGVLLFILLNRLFNRILSKKDVSGSILIWAVSLHNIPEGMAVGVVYAGILTGKGDIGTMSALALSLGIAMQNIPEGAIISLPLSARGKGKNKAFLSGFLSGTAELAAGIAALFFASVVYGILPFSLCFAAGAMIYVVLAELSSAFSGKETAALSLIVFDFGFVLMMLLDTFLG